MKVGNILTHHCGDHNVSGTTQASSRAKFKAIRNKLDQKRDSHSVQRHYALRDILQNTDKKLKQLLSKI